MFHSLLSRYLTLLETRPIATKAVTASAIAAAGDVLAQAIESRAATKPSPFNNASATSGSSTPSHHRDSDARMAWWSPSRTLRLASFGFLFAGPVTHYWYITLDRLVSPSMTARSALLKMAIDQTTMAPASVAVFFTYHGLYQGWEWDRIKKKVEREAWPTLVANWVLWPAALLVSFRFVPLDLRVLWMNVVGLGWGTYLSLVQQEPHHAAPLDSTAVSLTSEPSVKERGAAMTHGGNP
ncbi:hypothetical protein M427DRAFT_158774 [Gonapodya prolifera JEL478]|uniref:Uncharacterized protein n=1 Tax=Gonapodya prolifera (strain JEL478) TaxID=1344416 RepID=A0A139A2J2_GONPJ|nr:hypothetical protein M427DRAFT_158774 [Gonapodya prolifera JEL478]|eukprot:KXS10765.1 hypothetical protein M427DRAFT_158774 [Gonapodya prolifera JEL478]